MRIQFKIKGEKFRQLAELLRRLEVLIGKNSTFSILIEKPEEDNPLGCIRFHLDKPYSSLTMINSEHFLISLNFKSIQHVAVISLDLQAFHNFISSLAVNDEIITFSLKRKDQNKFLQVDIGGPQKRYRIPIEQTSLSSINSWFGIIDPEYKSKFNNKCYHQFINWLDASSTSSQNAVQLYIKKNSLSTPVIEFKAKLDNGIELDIETKVQVQIGQNCKQQRSLKKQGFQLLKLVFGMNDIIYLLKKKQQKQFAFEINGINSGPVGGDNSRQQQAQHHEQIQRQVKIQTQRN